MVNTGIKRFRRLLGLNTSLSKTRSLKGINHIDNINLFWGSGHLSGADGLHPSRSGVKVPMDQFWFSLQHPSARPPIAQPDTHQPRPHKDRASQPRCQRVDNQLMDQCPNSSSLHFPLATASPLLGFTDKMEVLVNGGIKFSSRSLPHPQKSLHAKQAHSVTPTLLRLPF